MHSTAWNFSAMSSSEFTSLLGEVSRRITREAGGQAPEKESERVVIITEGLCQHFWECDLTSIRTLRSLAYARRLKTGR